MEQQETKQEKKSAFARMVNMVLPTLKMKLIFLAVAVGIVAVVCIGFLLHNDKQSVDTTYMVSLLTKSSELTTAKLNYTGMSEFKDSGVAFINKSDFVMVYKATARIGIDVEKIKVWADDGKKIVYVEIPAVEIQDVNVDTDSIRYFDTKFSLFNLDQKEDANNAVALAKEEAKKEIQKMGVFEMAEGQAASLIKGILANAVPDGYEIEVKQ